MPGRVDELHVHEEAGGGELAGVDVGDGLGEGVSLGFVEGNGVFDCVEGHFDILFWVDVGDGRVYGRAFGRGEYLYYGMVTCLPAS